MCTAQVWTSGELCAVIEANAKLGAVEGLFSCVYH